jgi:capsular exopolysaccharide synthesis family protein
LVGQQQQLTTEKWMLDLQYPKLKGKSPEMISDAYNMTRRVGDYASESKKGSPLATEKDGPQAENGDPSLAKGPSTVPETGKSGVEQLDAGKGYQDQRVRVARLRKQREELAAYTQADNPKMRAIDDEIRSIQGSLELVAETEYARIKERVGTIDLQMEAMDEAIRRWRNSYLMASKKGADFRHLQQVVSHLEGMYGQLYSRLNDLRIDQEFKAERLWVSQDVRSSSSPVWPDAPKILLTALVAGLGSGLALALLAYFFDDKVQSVTDVETAVGVPFLGGVPFWVHSDLVNRVRPIVSDEHRSGAAEAYRALRTNVLAAVEKAGKKIILVTSADSKEGKTLTSLNLSLMIAKTGRKVLLLDMDLRRGVLHKSFELERTPGIVDALNEHHPLSSVVQATKHENLWFASAGSIEKNTSELLHATDLEAFLGEVVGQYDYILLDSAPVLRVTDTVILASCPLVCVIYVAHANRTSKPVIRYSLDMLGDVHVIGMIVNSIEMHRISSLYYAYQYPNYAYYSYAYRYGYNYDLYDEHGRKVALGPFVRVRRALTKWFRVAFMSGE